MSYEWVSERFKEDNVEEVMEDMIGSQEIQERRVNSTKVCDGCNRKIFGEGIKYEGKIYHKKCVNFDFTCSICNGKILSHQLVQSESGACFHPLCFKCSVCTKKLNAGGKYTERNGRVMCVTCGSQVRTQIKRTNYQQVMQQREKDQERVDQINRNRNRGKERCAACGEIIVDQQAIKALGKLFHGKCFVCGGCGMKFENNKFQMVNGLPYHPRCCPKRAKERCQGCGDEITGLYVKVQNSLYHKDCVRCTDCNKPVATGYAMVNGQIKCPDCAVVVKLRRTEFRRGFVVDPKTGRKIYK
ncbi:lim domain containing protein [Anaeramoeba flamelloides]|uniref:Lim domain containing protein n=1 Tax=Anaeramoeba flamelloides TaxID=1746091 RepID=A0ABQ8YCQ5_9EUKA|nr:lim domain containing protein [Anaeramoeba flamelloides]